jgi:hypothetical protein
MKVLPPSIVWLANAVSRIEVEPMQPRLDVSLLVAMALALTGCTGAPPSPIGSTTASPSEASFSAPSPSPSPGNQIPAAVAGTRIVFYRQTNSWPPPAFEIDPDGSHEVELQDNGLQPGIWSHDGRNLAISYLSHLPGQQPVDGVDWFRPAVVNSDGSGFKVLDGYLGRKLNLVPIGWSADQSRIYVMSGYDAANADDIGLFTVRSADGGRLTSVLQSPPGDVESGRADKSCARPDAVNVSPDGSRLLVNRISPGSGCGAIMLFDAVGRNGLQLNPVGTVAVDLEFWDFLERGRISEAWSSDGSRIAFGAYVLAAEASALYVAKGDGTAVRQIVSPDVGAVSVQWSPDGAWIAFTSKLKTLPQVWRVHPDGTDLQRLTDGTGGSTSVAAVWSPDGSKLLFERKQAGHVTLWTMNADGSGASQLSPTPISDDYFGPYAWWPAPPG